MGIYIQERNYFVMKLLIVKKNQVIKKSILINFAVLAEKYNFTVLARKYNFTILVKK